MAFSDTIRKYYQSVFYLLTVTLLLLISHFTAEELIFGSAIVFSFFLGCCVCKDFRFALYPFISFVTLCSLEHSPANPVYSKFFFEPLSLTVMFIDIALILAGLLIFALRNRRSANELHKGSGIFFSLLLFCILLFTNGLGSAKYTLKNLLLAFIYFAALVLLYLYFSAFIRFDRTVFDYFFLCLLFFGLTVSVEIYVWIIKDCEIYNGAVNKSNGFVGWGFFTTVGGVLTTLLPAGFYFARDHKFGWLGYLAGVLEAGALILAQSRGGMLWGAVVGVICVILICVSGKNRKINRWMTLGFVVLGAVGAFLLRDKIVLILQHFLNKGFSDNGRYALWKAALQNFKEYPIFGAGFYVSTILYEGWTYDFFPYMCHNTVLEILSTGGFVSFAPYLYHRIKTVILVFRKPNSAKTFFGLTVLGMLLFSMTDLLFFIFYPTFLYGFLLMMMERTDEFPELLSASRKEK